ncbi:NADPH-dependent F420 reductase [Nocardiopsis lambiniae]|uniref:NAD(P)-binding domain-containing protein n=1 Tax=Nocardiopsis lambiniae TaxID=3075539 RepID=A0ABU2MDI6_9ACTN|nr:NAD(P)-binding domain-containing protein [Nocardiopsis sp. DSM 44743]MDT0330625.1 NAD(P)-binding domain-containing protein [Nocardiopsis sp. DSM 44743]
MRVAVLGTGEVALTLVPAFLGSGHDVVVGTRDPAATLARNPSFGVPVTVFAEAVRDADLVVNAISGPVCVTALAPLAEALAGRILMDVSSPFDFSREDEIVLDPVNTDSLGERLQRALPEARVVKTFNTLAAEVMTSPEVAGADHSVFLSGDDDSAKDVVGDLLRGWGWSDVIDLGPIGTARATEMMLPMWMSLYKTLGTHRFGFKIAR